VGMVSLADVVKMVPGTSPSTISRYMRERQVTFMANGAPGADEGAIADAVMKAIADENLPQGYGIKPQGTTKMMQEVFISFILGLLASFIFMYLILAAQFESWLHPITILISLPLTLPFAILSVIIFGQALDLYSFLGIFVLFGVVKKNAILQIDHSNHLRSEWEPAFQSALQKVSLTGAPGEVRARLLAVVGDQLTPEAIDRAMAKAEKKGGGVDQLRRRLVNELRLKAILQANKDRLRPILMTTLAFVAGMVPLVTANGVGSGFNRATAGVVVGGQVLSLILTLVAVPVAYSLFDDASQFFARVFKKKDEEAPSESIPAPVAVEPLHEAEVAK
jgi:hydrophobic/amphiphilic exporter-1 (mainly G- bacteria), HAE1 family